MSNKKLVYPICLQAREGKYFLLWSDGGPKPDYYITLSNSKELVVKNSISVLRAFAKKMNFNVSTDEPACVDIDAAMKAIARIGNGPCSTLTASRILDGWNNLEDLARSVKVKISDFGESDALKNIYDKLFFGNNLPAVTPGDQVYLPVFSEIERRLMRCYLRGLWNTVATRMGI